MAAVDYFLKIDGIDGESTDDKHKKEIDIESWSWGAKNIGSAGKGGGLGAGKVQMDDFSFVMKHNAASNQLMLACSGGDHIKKAVFVARKQGGTQLEYLKITLSDVMISSYHTGASSGGDSIPTDQFSINFSKIEHSYQTQKPDGTGAGLTTKGWDLAANKKV
jgi:type VI secretion system secreted protein Hcp